MTQRPFPPVMQLCLGVLKVRDTFSLSKYLSQLESNMWQNPVSTPTSEKNPRQCFRHPAALKFHYTAVYLQLARQTWQLHIGKVLVCAFY